MNKFSASLLLVFISFQPFGSFAQNTVANNVASTADASTAALVEVCRDTNDQEAQNFCFGFGEGVYQSYLANLSQTKKPNICFVQSGDSREKILQEFLKWNDAHPQYQHEQAAKTLVRFFAQSYPCK